MSQTEHHSVLPMDRPLTIMIVGAGGNGAQMAAGLAQISVAIKARGGHTLHVEIADDDRVSAANVGRQLFSPADIGRPKADVLVERTNRFYGFSWESHVARVTEATKLYADVVIAAVDSAKSRVGIEKAALYGLQEDYKTRTTYVLDVGNQTRFGQVVLGAFRKVPGSITVDLPTVTMLYPELLDEDFNEQDQGPSCSLAEALQKQDLFINRDVTTPALHILWELLSKRRLSHHGVFTSLETLRRTPLPVDEEVWIRMNPKLKEMFLRNTA
ncbi:MAG: PRTRC system ThiF family protein [Acidithiobacillus ferrivorans]